MDASLGPTSGHKWIHSMYTIKRFVDFFLEISVGHIQKCRNLRSHDFQPYRIIIIIIILNELGLNRPYHRTPLKLHQPNALHLLITHIYCIFDWCNLRVVG